MFSDRVITGLNKRAPFAYNKRDVAIVDRDDHGQVKKLCNDIVKEGLELKDLSFSRPFLREIIQAATAKKKGAGKAYSFCQAS